MKLKPCIPSILIGIAALLGTSTVGGAAEPAAGWTRLDVDPYSSRVPQYRDPGGERYATEVTVKFTRPVIPLPRGQKEARLSDVDGAYGQEHFALDQLGQTYGPFRLVKMYPEMVFGDTLRRNRRTGEMVTVPELSQKFHLDFERMVPVEEVATLLEALPSVEYAHGPMLTRSTAEPNDWAWLKNYHWNLEIVDAPQAWDLSKGEQVVIAILDDFNATIPERHPDLGCDPQGNCRLTHVWGNYGGHGTMVASVAGAITNNGSYLASLGWEVKLLGFAKFASEIVRAVNMGADVINNSWVSGSQNPDTTRDEVEYALQMGVVVVGSAGNNSCTSCVNYPAAHHYPGLGQVIAVSATDAQDNFVSGYNCSPGSDPILDPESAFIDVAAPGKDVWVTCTKYLDDSGEWSCSGLTTAHSFSHTAIRASGTSFAAPLVSAQAALLLAEDPTLTPAEIYDLITGSAEKVGGVSYDANGWDECMGYGRVNVHQSLLDLLQ